WQPSAVPSAPAPTGRWLVTGTAGAGDPMRTRLRERLDEPADGPVAGVLFLAWHDTAPADVPAAAEQRALAVAESAASLVRESEDGGAPPPRLIVVTRQGTHPDPVQGALRGLVRTLAMERPELGARLIDLDPTTGPDAAADQLLAELGAPDAADETAWRGGTRHVASLQPLPSAPGGSRPVVRPDGGYVITGGTRGVGLRTAQWLVERGARHLVLNSRSAPAPESAARIAALRAAGAQVTVIQGDLAEPGVARRLVDAVAAPGVRLRGVVHAAAVLDDAVITGMDAERFRRVWRAKATGAWHLHTATTGPGLDWWIAYSSLASLIGSAGQANYAAANAFVDSLTAHRRALGLPGLAVNWGAWTEVGRVRDVEFAGFDKLGPREAFAALEELLGADAGQAGVVRFRPAEFLALHPHLRGTPFFTALAAGEAVPGDGGFEVGGLARLDAAARRKAVTARLALRTGQAMGLRDAASTVDRPLVALGLDSLAAVRIKALIHEDFGIDLPVTRLLEGASTADLAADLMAALDGPDPAGPTELRDTAVDQAVRRARQRTARTGRQQARRRKR
ncbi:beta-ketoacyl reductase, partial [Streptomyces sp. W16]|uniref:beta-ketoacyl reductase n=1 Tax=Streptomyces sp. W16 TaxID=3076631 RepID=UPI00295AF109